MNGSLRSHRLAARLLEPLLVRQLVRRDQDDLAAHAPDRDQQTWLFTRPGGMPTMLLDDDFLFEEQDNYPIADTLVRRGDTINTVCTYVSNTGTTMTWGDGSDREMCFTGTYKYPAGGAYSSAPAPAHLITVLPARPRSSRSHEHKLLLCESDVVEIDCPVA